MNINFTYVPGDGIGPEVGEAAMTVLNAMAIKFGHTLEPEFGLIGGAAIDAGEKPLPDDTFESCKRTGAILLGAVGGPKWDHLKGAERPELGSLLPLRKQLNLYANIRPCKPYPALIDQAPLKRERLEGTDFIVMRELTGGIYFGEKGRDSLGAYDECRYSISEIERIAVKAFDLAMTRRKKVTSVDKSNVLETSRLWRETVIKVAKRYPEVELEHLLVDAMTMHMLTKAQSFDVILTENMFGDILTDEASVLCGSMGVIPSASISDGTLGMYEPIHGSAPDIAGQGKANPLAMILSAAWMLRLSFGLNTEATAIETAVEAALNAGQTTGDLGGKLSTKHVGEWIAEIYHQMPKVNLNDLKARIEAADVYALAKRTPCQLAPKLSAEHGRNIWLKREDLQDVFSFKIRGACNRMAGLTDAEKAKGVCAASAGNHAQGMAAAAAYYKTKAVIFMPITTPQIKVDAVAAAGAETRLIGDSYDDACAAAIAYAKDSGAVFIHPFDELDVIAGQGTVGKEILEQMPRSPAAIYVCTGGGGLVSGIGTWVKAVSPQTKIIAVEPVGAATLQISLEAGKPTPLNHVDSFADGVAVKLIGENTLEISKTVVDEVITVTNDEICAAVKDVFEATRTVVEPAGALALAGLIKHTRQGKAPDGDCVVTISGANVNFDRIGHIVERAELGAGEEMLFAATIPEQAGAFLNFVRALGNRAVSEFNYRFAEGDDDAHVLVGVKIRQSNERAAIIKSMADQNISVVDLSEDRLAKRHLRHMVGGRASKDIDEVIYRFEFPERPGALTDFLIRLDARWNISLFHYRSHGHSTGHVLCGFQIPNDDRDALEASLAKTSYPMSSETSNVAYDYFLRA